MNLKEVVIHILHGIDYPVTIPELTNLIWKKFDNGRGLSFYEALVKTFEQGHVKEPKAELQNRIYAQNKNWKEIFTDKTTKPHKIVLNKNKYHEFQEIDLLSNDTHELYLSFEIACTDISDFLNHWEKKYTYDMEEKYNENIGKPLTAKSRLELFEWKNGSVISQAKLESINRNYPLVFNGNKEERYLNHNESGGAIWNIFYIHCLEPDKYPIYDQHTYRAMKYIQTKKILEIGQSNKKKYESYINEYLPFIKSLGNINHRKSDKALFAFGQFLKKAKMYV